MIASRATSSGLNPALGPGEEQASSGAIVNVGTMAPEVIHFPATDHAAYLTGATVAADAADGGRTAA